MKIGLTHALTPINTGLTLFKRLYLVAPAGNRLVTLDEDTFTTTSTFTPGNFPWDVQVNSLTNIIAVTNPGSDDVSIFSGAPSDADADVLGSLIH